MTGKRELVENHKPYVTHSPATVHCTGCTLVFGSWEEFGKHVDSLLAQPPHSREEAVKDVLSNHLGDFDSDNQLDPYIGDDGLLRRVIDECRKGSLFWQNRCLEYPELKDHSTVFTAKQGVYEVIRCYCENLLDEDHTDGTVGEGGLLRRVIGKCEKESLFWYDQCLELTDLGAVCTAKQDVYEAIWLYCENLLDETALGTVEES